MNIIRITLKYLSVSFLTFFFLASSNNIQAQTNGNEIKLGLVLSGGGAKGFAHIGVLKVFEEENIPISLISGNSIGTIVGALYSIGYSAQDIEDFTKKQDWDVLLSDDVQRRFKSRFKQQFEQKYILRLDFDREEKKFSLPSGLVVGNNILNIFCGATATLPDSIVFTELPIPFSCVAYNLETGKEETLDRGYLAKAMLASMAFPGVFSPVEFNGMKLLDGGIINNFPVDVAKEMGADIIIGVDLKQEKDKSLQFESLTTIIKEIANKIEIEKHNENVKLADVVINPKLDGISTFDFRENIIDSIIEKGEMAAREQLPKIKELIRNKNIKQNNVFHENRNTQWLITEIRIPEKYKDEIHFITTRLNLENNTYYTTDEIEKATERVFAYGNFETVTYKLYENSKGHVLELIIEDKKNKRLMLGASLNSVDVAAFYANFAQQNYSNYLSLVTLDAKIAVNPQLKFIVETHRLFLSAVGLELSGRFNKLNYHSKGKRLGKIDIGSAFADLYTYRRFYEVVDIGFGLKQGYYNASSYSHNSSELFGADFSGFSSSIYGYFTIDSRDDAYIPNKGLYMNSQFSLLSDNDEFSDIIPILDLTLNTITAFGDKISILGNLYHRSIFNTNNTPSPFTNYASNGYNAFTDFHFPILGQGGISFLDPVSTLGELGLRVDVGNKNFLTPKIQALFQFDKWSNIDMSNPKWSGGLTYQKRTKLGPIDFTLGFREKFKSVNFYGGLGYQF